jgi:hypothetical protein
LPAIIETPVLPMNAMPVSGDLSEALVYVTKKVVEQVNKGGKSQMQIAFSGICGGTRNHKVKIMLRVQDEEYVLVVGDSHAAWRTHQDSDTEDAFERLFAFLADRPGQRIPASRVERSNSSDV